jgi:uncharacterized spore protein YtfJ
MQESSSVGQNILSGLMERLKQSAHIEAAVGEPKTVGDRTIVPIGVVMYGFGAGAGSGGSERHDGGGGGGGGGGYVRVQPIALIETTPMGSRVLPVIDWTRLARLVLMFAGIWMIVRAIRRRRS